MAFVTLDEEKHEIKGGKLDLNSKNITASCVEQLVNWINNKVVKKKIKA